MTIKKKMITAHERILTSVFGRLKSFQQWQKKFLLIFSITKGFTAISQNEGEV